jgi:hypothetical protein
VQLLIPTSPRMVRQWARARRLLEPAKQNGPWPDAELTFSGDPSCETSLPPSDSRCAHFSCLAFSVFRLSPRTKDHNQNRDPKTDHPPNGIVQDWTRRHVVYPRFGPIESLIKLQHDPRAIPSWQAAEREDWRRVKDRDNDKDDDQRQRQKAWAFPRQTK